MTNIYKISTRRYGRILAILHLREFIMENSNIDPITIEKIAPYMPEYRELAEITKDKIISFANRLLTKYQELREHCISTINKASFNRSYESFAITDRTLLCIGITELTFSEIPSVTIKEILIISDFLNNKNAAPYLSGILKNVAFGLLPQQKLNKKVKICIKPLD